MGAGRHWFPACMCCFLVLRGNLVCCWKWTFYFIICSLSCVFTMFRLYSSFFLFAYPCCWKHFMSFCLSAHGNHGAEALCFWVVHPIWLFVRAFLMNAISRLHLTCKIFDELRFGMFPKKVQNPETNEVKLIFLLLNPCFKMKQHPYLDHHEPT